MSIASNEPEGLDVLQPNYEPKRSRGFTVFMSVVIGVLVLLVVLAVVADFVVRHYAEGQASSQIERALPEGSSGGVDVKIHGFSALLQVLNGRFDDMSLTSHSLVVGKVPLQFTGDAHGVPLAQGGTTGPVDATLTLDQAAINGSGVLPSANGKVTLGDGTFAYGSSVTVLGLKLGYQLTAKPSIDSTGTKLVLAPEAAKLTGGSAALDASALLSYLKANPIEVCLAQSLPKGTTAKGISVTPSGAALKLHSSGLTLDQAAFGRTGSC